MPRFPRRDEHSGASRAPTAVITVIVLIAATVGTFLFIDREEVRRDEEARTRHSHETATTLAARVDAYIEVLHGVRGHLAVSAGETPDAFAQYMRALDLDRRFPAARMVGVAVASSESDRVLPITHLHPTARNESMYGVDLLAVPDWAAAVTEARDTGGPTSTPPSRISQSADDQLAVFVVLPMYDTAETPSTMELRREHFEGVVVGAIQVDDLIASLEGAPPYPSIDLHDLGATGAGTVTPVVLHVSDRDTEEVALDLASPDVSTIEVAGRRWAVSTSPGDLVRHLDNGLKWGVIIGGFIVTALVIFAMAAAGRAERANSAKSRFLSRMSHELRTPLNAVIGFSQVIQIEDPEPETASHAAHIEGAGRHLLALIDDVLQISRIEAQEFQVTLEPVPVCDVIDEAAQLLEPQARDADVTLDYSQCDDIVVKADRRRLLQVLLNLGSNAIKYNRPNGHVEIRTRKISPRTLRIMVRDTGIGIPPDKHPLLFVPFERLGAEASSIDGIGLGLTLSEVLVDAMGGEIGFESQEDIGSLFWIDLRLAESESVSRSLPPRPAAERSRNGQGGVVLCVEDNEANLALATTALSALPDVTLLVARNGAEALTVLTATDVDLLLLDVNLPDVDGADLLQQARETSGARIPAIMLSADATTATIRRLERAGADEYLTKPVNVQQLIDTVGIYLEVTALTPVES